MKSIRVNTGGGNQAGEPSLPPLDELRHDLRNPVAGILGYAELLEDEFSGALSPEQREYVAAIMRNCDRLCAMIDSIR